jgi:hypothetical protein
MPGSVELFTKYNNNKIFVETGSYAGDGIQAALDSGYNRVYSIELSIPHYNDCKKKFENHCNVYLINGDSCDILESVIKDIDENITFWLDGHYSCGNTAKGKYLSPLMQELDAIKSHTVKTHTIIIDDMRCWNKDNPDIKFGREQIEQKLLDINQNYKFEYFFGVESNDILVAYI